MAASSAGALAGRTCIVTGATSGIGRVTAIELARRGAEVAILARDPGRAEETAQAIRDAAQESEPVVFLADLSSQAEVRRVAGEILAALPRIHLLVNNAGVVEIHRTTTVDGLETVFAVNHLAYFLLTNLLLERIVASAPARIVNVASHAHKFAPGIRFDDPGFSTGYRAMQVYGHSKLANILFTRELGRRLAGTGVSANCLHPGAVATGLGRNNGWWARAIISTIAPFFRSPERGAETTLHVATAPELDGVSGVYFADCRQRQPSAAALDDGSAARLWALSERLTSAVPHARPDRPGAAA